jgi:hypothetical protein
MSETREQLQERLNQMRAAEGFGPFDWEAIEEEFGYPLNPQQGPEPGEKFIEAVRAESRASMDRWHQERINDGLMLKNLRDTMEMYFTRDVAELPPGQRVEFLRWLGSLMRPYAPEAADILESTGSP